MKQKNDGIKSRLKSVLTWERNICRAIAAWSLYALILLLTCDGNFYELAFAQEVSAAAMILVIALLFCQYGSS